MRRRFEKWTGLGASLAMLAAFGCGQKEVIVEPVPVTVPVALVPAGATIPEGGVSLLGGGARQTLRNAGPEAACAVFEDVSGEGTGFASAIRGRVLEPLPEHAWYAQLATPVVEDLRAGEVVLLSFWSRAIDRDDKDGPGEFLIYLGTPGLSDAGPEEVVEPAIYRKVTVGSEWRQFLLPVRLTRNYEKIRTSVNLDFGFAVQTLEFAGVELRRYADRALSGLPDSLRDAE